MDTGTRIDFIIKHLSEMSDGFKNFKKKESGSNSGIEIEHVTTAQFVKREFNPTVPWLMFMGDDDPRKDTSIPNDENGFWDNRIDDILDDDFEIIFLHGLSFKWRKVIKTEAKYIRPLTMPGAKTIYETHARKLYFDTTQEYSKELVGLKKDGLSTSETYYKNKAMGDVEEKTFNLYYAAMAKHHLYREGIFHVTIVNSETQKGIKLAVDYDEVKPLFAYRDSPRTITGRKKPIIHWVREHLRKASKKSDHQKVKKHLKGILMFEADGYSITIKQVD